MSGLKQHEYWGGVVEREGADPLAERAAERASTQARRHRGPTTNCADHGHSWPPGGAPGPCGRCGKESAIPGGARCRHGAPVGFGGHDCQYADLREMLIPYAELAADRDVPDGDTVDGTVRWDSAFHRHMGVLAAAARALGRLP